MDWSNQNVVSKETHKNIFKDVQPLFSHFLLVLVPLLQICPYSKQFVLKIVIGQTQIFGVPLSEHLIQFILYLKFYIWLGCSVGKIRLTSEIPVHSYKILKKNPMLPICPCVFFYLVTSENWFDLSNIILTMRYLSKAQ